MIETIQVEKRDAVGSLAVRKLRQRGMVPAILYGHGEENVCLAVKREAVTGLVRHGAKLVSLTGAITETALLREVQWDTFGADVVHLDFARVAQSEKVQVTLPVHLHGEAPGVGADAQLRFISHELTIECPAASIPEYITVDISSLGRGQAIHVNELKLPEGMRAVTPANIVIVQVTVVSAAAEEAAGATGAEPELIRKEKEKAEASA
jgi:large subunit ribosomal protein L25